MPDKDGICTACNADYRMDPTADSGLCADCEEMKQEGFSARTPIRPEPRLASFGASSTLSPEETRAMNDFVRYEGYHGGAADAEALRSLEERGFLTSLERSAGEQPLYYLTDQGRKAMS